MPTNLQVTYRQAPYSAPGTVERHVFAELGRCSVRRGEIELAQRVFLVKYESASVPELSHVRRVFTFVRHANMTAESDMYDCCNDLKVHLAVFLSKKIAPNPRAQLTGDMNHIKHQVAIEANSGAAFAPQARPQRRFAFGSKICLPGTLDCGTLQQKSELQNHAEAFHGTVVGGATRRWLAQ